MSDEMKFIGALCLFVVIVLFAILSADLQSKTYRANCIVAMKDRPATEILAVCK